MQLRIMAIVFFLVAGSTLPVCYGAETNRQYRIVLAQFDDRTNGQYSYLRDSIQGMLATRMAAMEMIQIVDERFTKEQLADLKNSDTAEKTIPDTTRAVDYILAGTMYAIAGGLNIQVALYPFDPQADTQHYSIVVQNLDGLIGEIDQLAKDIAVSGFGYNIAAQAVQEGEDKGQVRSGFVTAHPEAAFKRKQYSGTVFSAAEGALTTETIGVKRTIELDRVLESMVVGDCDGDGVREIVVLYEGTLTVYHLRGKTLELAGKWELPPGMNCHAMNLADVDGDTKPEIFLSGTEELAISSVILSWDQASGFTVRAKDVRWYLRPVQKGGKWILAGQQRGRGKTAFVGRGVYRLQLGPDGLVEQQERFALPQKVNLFDFVYADLDGDQDEEIVLIDQQEKLKVYSPVNELLWVSEKTFGGSKTYIGPTLAETVDEHSVTGLTVEEDADRELVYVPGRIMVADMDDNGRREIIVSENTPTAWSVFKRMRFYKEGTVTAMAWNGERLEGMWRTGTFKGFISDFSFLEQQPKDTAENSSRQATIYVASRPTSGSLTALLPGMSKSQLIVFDIGFDVKKVSDNN